MLSHCFVPHQSVWQGDVQEEHRGGGCGLPRHAHHRVSCTLLHLRRPHKRHARQGTFVTTMACLTFDVDIVKTGK